MRLTAQPLSPSEFEPFGEVLIAPKAPGRHRIDRALECRSSTASPSLSFTRKLPTSLPMTSRTMERHPHSSQSFIPMEAGRWLIVVAPGDADDRPAMSLARAFVANPDQGVTFRRGVWHHLFTVLDRPASFAVFMWKDATPADDEFVDVPPFEVFLS